MLVNRRTIRFIVGLSTSHKHTTTMKITTQESQAEQARRLAAKTQDQRMVNEVTTGTGMSPWEAKVVIEVIREVHCATASSFTPV